MKAKLKREMNGYYTYNYNGTTIHIYKGEFAWFVEEIYGAYFETLGGIRKAIENNELHLD